MLLKTAGPGQAVPEIEKVYRSFQDTVGMVPPDFLMFSASPGIQAVHADTILYYRKGSRLSPLLAALIQYLTAIALEAGPCIEFSARVLGALGLTEEQIEVIGINPAAAPLDEKDGWMLALAVKAVQAPESPLEGHVARLRELGWTDTDIFDALYIPFMMIGMHRMMRALGFDGSLGGATGRQGD